MIPKKLAQEIIKHSLEHVYYWQEHDPDQAAQLSKAERRQVDLELEQLMLEIQKMLG